MFSAVCTVSVGVWCVVAQHQLSSVPGPARLEMRERERERERGAQSHNLFIDETQSGFSATTTQLPADAMKVLISKRSSAG